MLPGMVYALATCVIVTLAAIWAVRDAYRSSGRQFEVGVEAITAAVTQAVKSVTTPEPVNESTATRHQPPSMPTWELHEEDDSADPTDAFIPDGHQQWAAGVDTGINGFQFDLERADHDLGGR
jgi:hypothetical protein